MLKKNSKGFSLIELIVVIAIIGILVMLAAPRFLGYTEKARVARIQNDIKVVEGKVAEEYINAAYKFDGDIDSQVLDDMIGEKTIYAVEGKVNSVEPGNYKEVEVNQVKEARTKLKGTFYNNAQGKVYYVDGKSDNNDTGNNNKDCMVEIEMPEDILAIFIEREMLPHPRITSKTYEMHDKKYVYFYEFEEVIFGIDAEVFLDKYDNTWGMDEFFENLYSEEYGLIWSEVHDVYTLPIKLCSIDGQNPEEDNCLIECGNMEQIDYRPEIIINSDMEAIEVTRPYTISEITELYKPGNLKLLFYRNKVDNTEYVGFLSTMGNYASFEMYPLINGEVEHVFSDYELRIMNNYGSEDIYESGDLLLFPKCMQNYDVNNKPTGCKYNLFEYMYKGVGLVKEEPYVDGEPTELELELVDAGCKLATSNDFKGKEDGRFKYVGKENCVVVPHTIKGIAVTSYEGMFEETSVEEVRSNNQNITSMYEMFRSSRADKLILNQLDTSNVTNMEAMFSSSEAESMDLSNFNTSNVTDMSAMFSGQYYLDNVDISHFDTSNVESMAGMFESAKSTPIGLSNFNTSNVKNMGTMFSHFGGDSIDISNFNTSNVEDMYMMFWQAKKIKNLDLSNFNTSKVINMYGMFGWMESIESLNLTSFDTSKVEDMGCMFDMSNLNEIDISSFDVTSLKNAKDMIAGHKTVHIKNEAIKIKLEEHKNYWITWMVDGVEIN